MSVFLMYSVNECEIKFCLKFKIQIKLSFVFSFNATDTLVTTVTAFDADEPGNLNSQIAYSIIVQNPAEDVFYIDRQSGSIFVKRPVLDREV